MIPENFKEILEKGYSLDHIYILYLIRWDKNSYNLIAELPKVKAIVKGLVRNNLIDTDVTPEGEKLVEMWKSNDLVSIEIKTQDKKLEDFDKWWSTYPGTDSFSWKNRTFKGSRALRVNKDKCRIEFNKVLAKGEYTLQQMLNALNIEVGQKMEASTKENKNKLSFMQNSLTYLNQKTYEPYMELIGQKQTSKTKETAI